MVKLLFVMWQKCLRTMHTISKSTTWIYAHISFTSKWLITLLWKVKTITTHISLNFFQIPLWVNEKKIVFHRIIEFIRIVRLQFGNDVKQNIWQTSWDSKALSEFESKNIFYKSAIVRVLTIFSLLILYYRFALV